MDEVLEWSKLNSTTTVASMLGFAVRVHLGKFATCMGKSVEVFMLFNPPVRFSRLGSVFGLRKGGARPSRLWRKFHHNNILRFWHLQHVYAR